MCLPTYEQPENACMNALYAISDISSIYSPGLLFYKDLIRRNIARLVELAGDAGRVRPHVKTHKTREIVRMAMDAGIQKHKCATLAEAEMLAGCGVADVLLAYNMVGPNCGRMVRLAGTYPNCRFAVTADHAPAADALAQAMSAAGQSVDVLLDVDVGQHRTGVAPGPEAVALYERIARLPGLRPGAWRRRGRGWPRGGRPGRRTSSAGRSGRGGRSGRSWGPPGCRPAARPARRNGPASRPRPASHTCAW